jgi:hypothetical protein
MKPDMIVSNDIWNRKARQTVPIHAGGLEMTAVKVCMLIAMIGHLLCQRCDWFLAYTKDKHRINLKYLNDNENLSKEFEGATTGYSMISIMLGVVAIALMTVGYYGLSNWMRQYSVISANIMLISGAAFIIFITAHHVFCGIIEWFYIKLGRTDAAHEAIVEFFKKTISTMYVGYVALLVFMVTLFIAVVTGGTSLPAWACIFNTLPLFIILIPFKLVGTGNIAGTITFLGLLIFI